MTLFEEMSFHVDYRHSVFDFTLNFLGVCIGIFVWIVVQPIKVMGYKLVRFVCHFVFNVFDYNMRESAVGGRSDRDESIIFYKIRKEMRENRKRGALHSFFCIFNYFNYLKYDILSTHYRCPPDEKNYDFLFQKLDLFEVMKKYLFFYINLLLTIYILFTKFSNVHFLRKYHIYVALDELIFGENLNNNGTATLNILTFFLVILIYFTNNQKNRKDIKNWLSTKLGVKICSIKDSRHTVLNSINDIEMDLKRYKFAVFEEVDEPDILLCTMSFEEVHETIEFKGMVEDGFFGNGKVIRVIQIIDFDDFTILHDDYVSCHTYEMEKDGSIVTRNFFQIKRILKYGFNIGIRELNFYDFVSLFFLALYFLTSITWRGAVDVIFVLWTILFPVFFSNVKRRKSIVVAMDFYNNFRKINSRQEAHRSFITANDDKIISLITGYTSLDFPGVTRGNGGDQRCGYGEMIKHIRKPHEVLSCIIKVLHNVHYNWSKDGIWLGDFCKILLHMKSFSDSKIYLQFSEGKDRKPTTTIISFESGELRRARIALQEEFNQANAERTFCFGPQVTGGLMFTISNDDELSIQKIDDIPTGNTRVIPCENLKDMEFEPWRFIKARAINKAMNPIQNTQP